MLNFIVYAVAGSGITTSTDVPENLQHLKIVVRLVEPLVNLGYALWMDSHYTSPSSAFYLQMMGVSVAHPSVSEIQEASKGKSVTAECTRVMFIMERDKISVIHIHVIIL